MGDKYLIVNQKFIIFQPWQTLATGVTDDSRSDTDSADDEEEEEEDTDLSIKTKKTEWQIFGIPTSVMFYNKMFFSLAG